MKSEEIVRLTGSVDTWIVCAMRFQKISDFHSVEHHKVEKWSSRMGSGWV